MRSRAELRRIVVAAACVLAAGCYHWAELTTTWGGTGDRAMPVQRVAVVFTSRDGAFRRGMENRLILDYPRSHPSFDILDSVDVGDSAAVRRVLVTRGFDVVLIVSVVQTDGRRSFIPGATLHVPPAPAFGSEWVRTWADAFDPSRVAPKASVAIEVRMYSLVDDRLIWAGRGDAGYARAVTELADAAMKHLPPELEREGLVAQQGTALPLDQQPIAAVR